MNRLTLFGEFVEGLRDHFASRGTWQPEKYPLVWEITRQESESQASRYLHEYDASKELYFYHKSTIAQIIAASYEGTTPDRSILRKRGRGHQFIGSRNDTNSVKVLASAIEGVMGEQLRQALHNWPLQADSTFCKRMYKLYDERYGREDPQVSDLERYVLSINKGLNSAQKSEEVYKRLLLAILLGPEAIPTIAQVSSTATMADSTLDMAVDGFSLTQLVVQKGVIEPLDAYGFEDSAEVAIGNIANPQATYSPTSKEGVRSYVSRDHAVIQRDEAAGKDMGWKLVNHSISNGTAVKHADGSVWFTKTHGDTTPLRPGDEIWLAPLRSSNKVYPEYDRGAVLRFDHILAHRRQRRPKLEVAESKVIADTNAVSATPVFENSNYEHGSQGARAGFVLEDLVHGTGSATYRYDNIADDEGGFEILLGRQGDYTTGISLGSAVSKKHAYIERFVGSDEVMITNLSQNEVIVRHDGGTFDELGEWDDTILLDGDEIYLAGGVSDSTVHAASNGTIIRFRYLYRIGAESL